MATARPRIGLDHPTVVPTNFDPDDDGESDDAEAASAERPD